MSQKINKYLNWKQNTTYQNVYDTAKAVFEGKFIAQHLYYRSLKINYLIFHLKKKSEINETETEN